MAARRLKWHQISAVDASAAFQTRSGSGQTAAAGSWKLKFAFSAWSLLALLTSLELGFAAFVDTTDAFNATNVCHRWFRRHVDPYRNRLAFAIDGTTGWIARRCAADLLLRRQLHDRAGSRPAGRSVYGPGRGRTESCIQAQLKKEVDSQISLAARFSWDVSLIEGIVGGALEQEIPARHEIIYMPQHNKYQDDP